MDVSMYFNCVQIYYRSLIPLVICDTTHHATSQDDFLLCVVNLGTREIGPTFQVTMVL